MKHSKLLKGLCLSCFVLTLLGLNLLVYAQTMGELLILSAQDGDLEMVKQLVEEENVVVNIQATNGSTALMAAAWYGHLHIVQYLYHQEANINLQDNDGSTALMYAALNGQRDIVRYLVEHGANVNQRDHSGKKAMHYAEAKGHTLVAEYLRIYTSD